MWAIIKYKKNSFYTLQKELIQKIDKSLKIFIPKIKIQKVIKNNITYKDIPILGDYLFCYHPCFRTSQIINKLKFCRGLEYFLSNYLNNQNEIEKFINDCKKNEDQNGYIKQSFFNFNYLSEFQFLTGPFLNQIFKILNKEKDKINILVKNKKITVSKDKHIFRPV
tara:strand:+ start:2549 stop:3046 length:498 start_codon:yes stop_codon:yes gene_type:complete